MPENIFDHRGGHVHFVGAGGSSMSGLALLLKQEGFAVTGSDRTRSHNTEMLEARGIPVTIGHRAENIQGADVLVFSAAIPAENPERAAARAAGVAEIERCDLLGQLMLGSRFAVGVSGTHGKTTTTAMLAQTFLEAGADPTIHIGGELDFIGGSTRLGSSGDFLCEACEYNRSFLHFFPTVAVILNIDEDHLDCYRDLDDIESAFARYAALVPENGWVVAWGDDERARRVAENSARQYITYGTGARNRLRPENLRYDELGRAEFDAALDGRVLGRFHLSVATEANMLDALAVIAVAHVRGLDMSAVARALHSFKGAHRRFERTSVTDGVALYTDYGHNPAEIKNALRLAALQPHKKLWSVWQPHTYSRTKKLFDSFVSTFDQADILLITDICGAREVDPGDISSEMLLEPIRRRGIEVHLTPTFDDAEAYLRAHWSAGDIVVTHGCGDIDLLNEQIALHGDTKA